MGMCRGKSKYSGYVGCFSYTDVLYFWIEILSVLKHFIKS